MADFAIKIRDVRVEGYPDSDENAVFLFDGCWVSGWPVSLETDDYGLLLWGANEDVGRSTTFYGVRHWTVLPTTI